MENWLEAYSYCDTALLNSRLMWIVYISFFILAVIVRKSENKTRHTVGSVMLGASMPGLLISIGCLGLFVYSMAQCYKVILSKEYYNIGDSPVVRNVQEMCNSVPVTFMLLSIALFFILALISIICAIVLLGKKAGKGAGVITLLYGLSLTVFAGWFLMAVTAFLAA